jgi:hypothetical protein
MFCFAAPHRQLSSPLHDHVPTGLLAVNTRKQTSLSHDVLANCSIFFTQASASSSASSPRSHQFTASELLHCHAMPMLADAQLCSKLHGDRCEHDYCPFAQLKLSNLTVTTCRAARRRPNAMPILQCCMSNDCLDVARGGACAWLLCAFCSRDECRVFLSCVKMKNIFIILRNYRPLPKKRGFIIRGYLLETPSKLKFEPKNRRKWLFTYRGN